MKSQSPQSYTTSAARTSVTIAMTVIVAWLALKDWFLSDSVPYPYCQSSAISVIIIGVPVAAALVKYASVWRNILAAILTGACMLALIALYWVASLTRAGSGMWQAPQIVNLLTSNSTLFTLGVCSLALGLPPLAVYYLHTAWERRPWTGLHSFLQTKVTIRALYGAAALSGLACLLFCPNVEVPLTLAIITVAIGTTYPMIQAALKPGSRSPKLILTAFCLVPIFLYVGRAVGPLLRIDIDTRKAWIGSGLAGSDPTDPTSFLSQQGLITFVLVGFTLLAMCIASLRHSGVLWDFARSANHDSHDRFGINVAERSAAMELCCGAVAALTVLQLHGLIGVSATSIVIAASHGPYRPVHNTRFWFPRAVAVVGASSVLLVCWLVNLCVLNARLSSDNQQDGTRWRSIPSSIKDVLAQLPTQSSWPDEHRLLRHCSGANVEALPSMTDVIALQAASQGRSANLITALSAVLAQEAIRSEFTKVQIEEHYLNLRDYGFASGSSEHMHLIGIDAAAMHYFGKPPGSLTKPEARFLMCTTPAYTEAPPHFALVSKTPGFMAQPLSQYRYHELAEMTDLSFMMHDGRISNHGLVAGSIITNNHGTWPFLWNHGIYKLLPGLSGVPDGHAVGINDAGESVGSSGDYAVLWDANGHITKLGTLPGFTRSVARAINNRGQVVGYSFNVTSAGSAVENLSHAFLWESGHIHDLGVPPGCTSSRAYAINDAGQIAGFLITDQDKSHACVWQSGVVCDIGTYADGDVSIASAINNAGIVTGQGNHADGTVSAFVWQNGALHDLGTLAGDRYSRARGINDSGDVVGESRHVPANVDNSGGRSFIWDAEHGMRDLIPSVSVDCGKRKALALACAVYSINNEGEILGINRGFPERLGHEVNFVLEPTTSPSNHAKR